MPTVCALTPQKLTSSITQKIENDAIAKVQKSGKQMLVVKANAAPESK